MFKKGRSRTERLQQESAGLSLDYRHPFNMLPWVEKRPTTYRLEVHAQAFVKGGIEGRPLNDPYRNGPIAIKTTFDVHHLPYEESAILTPIPTPRGDKIIRLYNITQSLDGSISADWRVGGTGYLKILNLQDWINQGWCVEGGIIRD